MYLKGDKKVSFIIFHTMTEVLYFVLEGFYRGSRQQGSYNTKVNLDRVNWMKT